MNVEKVVAQIGNNVKMKGFFRIDDVLTDPTAVFAAYRKPSGVITTLTYGVDAALVKVSTGCYYALVPADEAGIYEGRIYSTGTAKANQLFQITVHANPF